MKRVALLLLAIGVGPALLIACSSSDRPPGEGSGPGPFGADGGPGSSQPGSDGGGGGSADGSNSDADQGDAQTAPGPLTVTVSSGKTGPVAGASVVFHDTDGTEETVVTDATGNATRETIHAGATVTVAVASAAGRTLTTIANVEPSEVILVGSPIQSFVAIPYQVDVAAYGGATSYVLDWGCSLRLFPSAGTQSTGNITSKCLDANGALNILLTARSAAGAPLAYAFKTVTPGSGSVSLSVATGDWTAAGPAATLSLANAPATAASMSGAIRFVAGTASFAIDDSNVPLSFVRPPATFTTSLLHGAELYLGGSSFSGHFELQPLGTGDIQEDASTYLPQISAPLVTLSGTTPSLSWTSTGDLAGAGGFIAQLSSSMSDTTPITWTFLFAGQAATTFTPPALPAGLSAFVPSDPWAVTSLMAFDSPQITYRDVQRQSTAYQSGIRNRDLAALGTSPFSLRYTETGP